MKISKKIRKHITLLYCGLLAFILLWIVTETIHTVNGNGLPVKVTESSYSQEIGDFNLWKSFHSNFDIPITANTDSSIIVRAKIHEISAKVICNNSADYRDKTYGTLYQISNILRMLLLVALLGMVILMVTSIIRGARTGDVFPHKNILYTRVAGILILLYAMLNSLRGALNVLSLRHLFKGTDYEISGLFSITFDTFIIVIVVFIFAEIFAIGNSISEENKMTI